MQNINPRVSELFYKYMGGQLTEAERQEFLDYAEDPIFHNEINDLLSEAFENQTALTDVDDLGRLRLLDKIFVDGQITAVPKKVKLWPRIGIAAAVATIIVSAGIWFYRADENGKATDQVALVNDAAPGRSGATLTLASGQKIRLTDAVNGELAKESGVTITKTASGQLIYEIKGENTASNKINVLTTDNGETYQVRLPDGSSVWLNAASTLKYPASFARLSERRVELSGEGYFEVAKDKAHPFIVKTLGQEVRVLGTHFNINAYADEPAVATTLLEGSVKLSTGNSDKLLKPGEQAVNADGNIKVGKVNMDAIVDWKNEEFYLDKMDFRVAMRKIARWYDIEVIYNGSVPVNLEAGGWIPRNNKLSDVLKAIESTGQVHFKIEGKKLYVSK